MCTLDVNDNTHCDTITYENDDQNPIVYYYSTIVYN